MEAETRTFDYKIFFKSSEYQFDYSVTISNDNYQHPPPVKEKPEWCALEYKKCPNCTLSGIWHTECPLALRLIPFVELPSCNSYDEVHAEVEFDGMKVTLDTSAQEAFSSLLGLVMATSGCPHTEFFKPMAWYHRPFSSPDEAMYRACTTYLFSHFVHQGDSQQDLSFDFLKVVYQNIHTINVHIASRIKNYLETDSAINAIVLLDLITKDLPIAIDEDLEEIKNMFSSHQQIYK